MALTPSRRELAIQTFLAIEDPIARNFAYSRALSELDYDVLMRLLDEVVETLEGRARVVELPEGSVIRHGPRLYQHLDEESGRG